MTNSPSAQGSHWGAFIIKKRLDLILYGIVAVGIVMRVVFLLSKGTLWFDEATVGINLRESFGFLLQGQLHYDQRAPVGWLLLHKAVYEMFGASAVAVRFPALLASIAALVFLLLIVRQCLRPPAAIAVMGIAAFSPTLVLYSAELKHYSFDFLAGAFFAWLILFQHNRGYSRNVILLFIVAAIATALLSLPGVFCAAGAQIAICLAANDWRSGARRFLQLSAWTPVSAACLYWFATVYPPETRSEYHGMWGFGYMANEPSLRGIVTWPLEWIIGLQEMMLGSASLALIATGLLAVALIAWEVRFRLLLIGVSTVLIMAIVGSALGLYPPVARLALFALPAVLILTGIGLDWVATHPRRGVLLAWCCAGLAILGVLYYMAGYIRHGYISGDKLGASVGRMEDITQGLKILQTLDTEDRVLLLIPKATTPAVAFHHPRLPLPQGRIWIEGRRPFDPEVNLSRPETFSTRFYPPSFEDSFIEPAGPLSRYEATAGLLEVMREAASGGNPVALIVTQGSSLFRQVTSGLGAFPAPKVVEFPGGLIIWFDSVDTRPQEAPPTSSDQEP